MTIETLERIMISYRREAQLIIDVGGTEHEVDEVWEDKDGNMKITVRETRVS